MLIELVIIGIDIDRRKLVFVGVITFNEASDMKGDQRDLILVDAIAGLLFDDAGRIDGDIKDQRIGHLDVQQHRVVDRVVDLLPLQKVVDMQAEAGKEDIVKAFQQVVIADPVKKQIDEPDRFFIDVGRDVLPIDHAIIQSRQIGR